MDESSSFRASLSTNSLPSTPKKESDAAGQLAQLIEAKEATIGIVGLGYVGLPLAVAYAECGFSTVGIDLDDDRVRRLNEGESYIDDVDSAHVQRLVAQEQLQGVSTFDQAKDIDVFFLCVPTPVTATNQPDTSYIESASQSIATSLRPGQLVILKSTTYPDTTEGLVQPILEDAAEEKGIQLGRDYFLAFSPERVDPGNQEYSSSNLPVVVGGVTETGSRLAKQILAPAFAEVHPVSSPKVAETEKLLENIYRSVNIALVNELAQLCDRIGDVSIWEVIEAAATKPFGFEPFYPGPGLGGHCIPIDPHYLSWVAQKHDFETSFITLSARVNEQMPFYVVESVVEAVARQPVRFENADVLILGVAYKSNVNDTRRSPASKMVKLLREKGIGEVRYHDPHVEEYQVGEAGESQIQSVELTPRVLEAHNATVVVTNHDVFEPHFIAEHGRAIVDTRNALEKVTDPELRKKITLLGGDGD